MVSKLCAYIKSTASARNGASVVLSSPSTHGYRMMVLLKTMSYKVPRWMASNGTQ